MMFVFIPTGIEREREREFLTCFSFMNECMPTLLKLVWFNPVLNTDRLVEHGLYLSMKKEKVPRVLSVAKKKVVSSGV